MRPFEKVYKYVDGALVKNTQNRVGYKDEMGRKRVRTNPTYKDLSSQGLLPVRRITELTLKDKPIETATEKKGCFVVNTQVMGVI